MVVAQAHLGHPADGYALSYAVIDLEKVRFCNEVMGHVSYANLQKSLSQEPPEHIPIVCSTQIG